MFGGKVNSFRWMAVSGLWLAITANSLAQHAPVMDNYAPAELGVPPIVSASDLPIAQQREMPLWPGEDPNPGLFPGLRAMFIGSPENGIRTVGGCTDVIDVAPSGGLGSVGAGCTGCGLVGDDCGCSGGILPAIAMPVMAPLGPKRFDYFVEWLYMRARNTDVAYAVPVDGPIAAGGGGVQVGPVDVIGLDYESQDGYRLGGSLLLNDGAQIGGAYTTFENIMTAQAFAQAPNVLRSLVNHPLANNAAIDSLRADARYEVEFELADLFYQAHLFCNDRTTVDYVLGLRYAELNQRLNANYETNGVTSINTDVEFYGFGPRIGLGLDHQVGCLGLSIFSKGSATFIPGTSRGYYTQRDVFGGNVVDTVWESGCIMTQLDFEVGLGWSPCDRFRLSAGYLVSAWLNTPTTTEFISAVQDNDFNSIEGDGLTFDGLVLRGDVAF